MGVTLLDRFGESTGFISGVPVLEIGVEDVNGGEDGFVGDDFGYEGDVGEVLRGRYESNAKSVASDCNDCF